MAELFDQMWQLIKVLFDSAALFQTLSQPGFVVAMFILLTAIIFTETGLLVGFFLPGDSLLVTVGLVFYNLIFEQGNSPWLLPAILVLLSAAAIAGDTVGYSIGYKSGPRIFSREKSFFFRKDHLLAAQAFYEKHGGKTIVLARFMPILRTFAPVVAGIGKMNYRRFLFYNVIGGIGWVVSLILLGFILTPFLNPMLQPLLGDQFKVEKHIEKVIILVVLASIAPGVFAWVKHKFFKRKPAPAETPV